GSRQAAGVAGEYPIGAAFHVSLLPGHPPAAAEPRRAWSGDHSAIYLCGSGPPGLSADLGTRPGGSEGSCAASLAFSSPFPLPLPVRLARSTSGCGIAIAL